MGLFGGGFSNPGPGVDKDAPKKKGLFLYAEIFVRKFWKLMQVNGIYFLCSIPFIILLYLMTPVSSAYLQQIAERTAAGQDVAQIQSAAELMVRMMFAVGVFTALGFGIAAPGYSYILRCFAREQHAWIWSDFKDKIKENWKQGLIVFIIDLVVLVFGLNALLFYFSAFKQTNGQSIWLFVCYLTALLLLIYVMAHFYLHQLMVTFKCSIKQLYKNAFILAFAKLPMNLLFAVLGAGLFLVVFMFINPLGALLLSALIWVSMIRFPAEFYAARVIEREILGNREMQSKPDDREHERLE